jgi:hypothetical protein
VALVSLPKRLLSLYVILIAMHSRGRDYLQTSILLAGALEAVLDGVGLLGALVAAVG